jgi:anti-anti-sigma regulatory factor
MTIRIDGPVIYLEGRCRLEEAETLLDALLQGQAEWIDLSSCTYVHTAVLQMLLAGRLPVRGQPDSAFLVQHVLPMLPGARSASVVDAGPL